MFLFSDYKQLSWQVRSLGTRYWVAWIKDRLGVSAAYSLKKRLLTDEVIARKQPGWVNSSSRFWNRKENGQPVTQEKLVDQVEAFKETEGSKWTLCHPFWQLIDAEVIDQKFLNHILLQLPSKYVTKLFRDEMNGIRKPRLMTITSTKLEVPYDLNSLTCFLVLAIEEGLAGSEDNCYRIHGRQMTAIKLFLRLCVLSPMSAIAHDLYDVISKRLRRLHSIDSYEPFYFVFTDRNQNQDCIMNCFFGDAYELFYNSLSLFEEWLSQAKEIDLVQKTILDERAFLWSVFLTEAQQLEHVLFNEKLIMLEQHPYIKKLLDRMNDYKKYVGP